MKSLVVSINTSRQGRHRGLTTRHFFPQQKNSKLIDFSSNAGTESMRCAPVNNDRSIDFKYGLQREFCRCRFSQIDCSQLLHGYSDSSGSFVECLRRFRWLKRCCVWLCSVHERVGRSCCLSGLTLTGSGVSESGSSHRVFL